MDVGRDNHYRNWRPGTRADALGDWILQALGVQPLLGRWLSQMDDSPSGTNPAPVMLTFGYWQQRFGGDKSVIGHTLTVDSSLNQIVGIMPANLRFYGFDPYEHSDVFGGVALLLDPCPRPGLWRNVPAQLTYAGAAPGLVALVSENLAHERWSEPSAALAKRIRRPGSFGAPWCEIIGVAGDVYNDGVQKNAPTIVYWPSFMADF